MTLKYIREYSDCHLNIYFSRGAPLWEPVPLETDKETALILAGDLWEGDKFISHSEKSWIAPLADRFHSVIIVLGNHDIWGENLTKVYKKIKNRLFDEGLFNVHLLQNEQITIDGTRFIGATLWTDFNKQDPFTVWQAKNHMNDYNYIRVDESYRKLRAEDILQEHKVSKKFIFNNSKRVGDEKIIVVTHHSPSFQSLSDQYRSNGYSNGYYHSEFGDLIVDSDINLWTYGHTHCPMTYKIGNTLLMNNAVGYFQHEDTEYDQINLIDISTL